MVLVTFSLIWYSRFVLILHVSHFPGHWPRTLEVAEEECTLVDTRITFASSRNYAWLLKCSSTPAVFHSQVLKGVAGMLLTAHSNNWCGIIICWSYGIEVEGWLLIIAAKLFTVHHLYRTPVFQVDVLDDKVSISFLHPYWPSRSLDIHLPQSFLISQLEMF